MRPFKVGKPLRAVNLGVPAVRRPGAFQPLSPTLFRVGRGIFGGRCRCCLRNRIHGVDTKGVQSPEHRLPGSALSKWESAADPGLQKTGRHPGRIDWPLRRWARWRRKRKFSGASGGASLWVESGPCKAGPGEATRPGYPAAGRPLLPPDRAPAPGCASGIGLCVPALDEPAPGRVTMPGPLACRRGLANPPYWVCFLRCGVTVARGKGLWRARWRGRGWVAKRYCAESGRCYIGRPLFKRSGETLGEFATDCSLCQYNGFGFG